MAPSHLTLSEETGDHPKIKRRAALISNVDLPAIGFWIPALAGMTNTDDSRTIFLT